MNLINAIQTISIIGLMLTSYSTSAIAQELSKVEAAKPVSIEANELTQKYSTIKMHSLILGEDRELLIHLPNDYHTSEKTYSVLYALDGNRHLPHAVITEEILQSESLISQNLIVGIKTNRGTRRRDLSSGKENIIHFIKEEVFTMLRTH